METLLTPRDAVVTPVNPARVNMAGSVMGSHMRRPMCTKRAKALAATRREESPAGLPMIIAKAPPHPPQSAATVVADTLTTHLGKIFQNGHKKDQFDNRYKCWKALVHHQEELEARSVMQEMMTYREPLTENQGEEEEEDDGVEVVDEEVEVVGVLAIPAGEGSASPDSLATRRIARQSRQQQQAPEEFEEVSVNLLEESEEEGREEKAAEEEEGDDEDDDESTLLSPPPPKPIREPILPLYTNKAPFDKPLLSNRPSWPRRDQVVVTNSKKQKKNTASLDIDDINTQALMDFNTQALMDARSSLPLPPPPPKNHRFEGGL